MFVVVTCGQLKSVDITHLRLMFGHQAFSMAGLMS